MQLVEDYTFVIDTQLNSHFLKKYIEEFPSRNKIVSSYYDLSKSYNLCNSYLKNLIQFFMKYKLFDKDFQIELQANEFNCGILIKNFDEKLDNNFIDYLSKYDNLSYLQINNTIFINNKYIDIYEIKRNYFSFHQNDDIVRKYLYKFLIENINFNIQDLILFGGEMYLFQKLIKHNNLYAYSDFESIIEDTKYNNTSNKSIKLVDYNTFVFDEKISCENSLTICNTSKTGLGANLCNQIKTKYVIIISCNKKSFMRDYKLLQDKYVIKKNLEVNNINIYLLSF